MAPYLLEQDQAKSYSPVFEDYSKTLFTTDAVQTVTRFVRIVLDASYEYQKRRDYDAMESPGISVHYSHTNSHAQFHYVFAHLITIRVASRTL